MVDLLDRLYGAEGDPADPNEQRAINQRLSQRLSALIAELRVTREALLAAQRRTDVRSRIKKFGSAW